MREDTCVFVFFVCVYARVCLYVCVRVRGCVRVCEYLSSRGEGTDIDTGVTGWVWWIDAEVYMVQTIFELEGTISRPWFEGTNFELE